MDVSAPIEVFLSRYHNLPQELQHALRDTYIDLPAVASTALRSEWSTPLFVHLRAIFADVCARWSQSDEYSRPLAAFGRIIPFAPQLVAYAELFLERHAETTSSLVAAVPEDQIIDTLLAIFRLLIADCDTFKKHLNLNALHAGLQHGSRPVRYLTVRIICAYLQAADAARQDLIQKYLGSDGVEGPWEDKIIDYSFLSLWEEKRWEDTVKEQNKIQDAIHGLSDSQVQKLVREEDLSPLTTSVFGTIMPRLKGRSLPNSEQNVISALTTVENVRRFTDSLAHDSPILITGLAGSGKTTIVTYCARILNRHDSMVTLHLNEQSDAKMLVGMYTSGTTPGSFVWHPGVLTTAVREGRWVFIEDLDRAPNEIISVLLPLIERRELLVPSRGETIRAAPGFKIIATMRTTRDLSGKEILPKRNMIGIRFWRRISIDMLTEDELKEVVVGRYSNLQPHAGQIIAVYSALQDSAFESRFAGFIKTGSTRPRTPRDLFKWCQRLSRHFFPRSGFSDSLLDEMFLEAVDCFSGYLSQGEMFSNLASTIAEQLHIDAGRRDHLLHNRVIKLSGSNKGVSIGRITLSQNSKSRGGKRQQSFAHSPHSLRLLEKLAVAVNNKESVLLVGETGIGKTTCIQHLAAITGQKLVSFNLSQQSESGDLLGGFKPINVRGLIMPLREEFDELFFHPVSPFAKRQDDNQHFVDMLGKAIAKAQWKKVCLMWKSASSEVLKNFEKVKPPKSPTRASESHHPSKRRRTADDNATSDEGSLTFYQARWNKFAADIKELEGHLSGKANAFAFKFVEGSLVKAVRNGHWILLDEINLATTDTLEALVDLLGSPSGEEPSLLLTESGNIERITAHPNFRVFAAMNPATDIGKKDLPPGIRSRFTELFIDSPDRDMKSLQHIVASYLPDELGSRIAGDVTNLYMDVQKLAESNNLTDGAGQKPHFSLRTLTRTLVYARDVAAPVGGKDGVYRRALYEGFHMSFLTLLDNASEGLVAPKITQHLFSKHANAKAELSKPLPKPADSRIYVQEGHYWLQKGAFEPEEQPHYIITPFVQRNLNNLIRAISTRKLPILIQGPTSSGKTSMVEYLAKKSGNKFLRINNHEHTDLQEYLGSYISGTDGQLRFQEGVLVEALRKGYWIVLDELNLAPTDVLEALNRLLDDNRELLIPETQEIVTPHPDFMLFATQNPAGLYGGRKHLSRAFRNRFLELHFDDIPVNELCEILQRRTQIPPSWAQRIVDTYKELSSLRQENRMFEQKSFATLRDLFRWALRKADDKQQLAMNGYMLLGERVRKPEEREKVKTIIEQVMSREGPKVQLDVNDIFSRISAPDIALYQSKVEENHGVVWTKSMCRLYVLVANAIRNNEPVLLVGETGCGKTTVCQMLADALEKELFIVNAHQNTETGDLIGSQRPIRNRAATEARLSQLLRMVLPDVHMDAPLQQLWSAFEALPTDKKSTLSGVLVEEIQLLRGKSQALFEWTDGNLVHAMKTGQLFLLDEISLADDSVLERLNSVLEPSRTLLLAEKGSAADASVTAIDGFQFLATMNPGGDYGKRELSPALRNRFTEIWVPSLYDVDDILEIVRAKLVPTAARFAEAIVSFSSWFNERYNTSAASAISIRDTLAWIEFVNNFSSVAPIQAVLHGAAMVYIDTLGANPAAMLSISMAAIDTERSKCVDELSRLLAHDLSTDYFSTPQLHVSTDQLSIGGFVLPRLPDALEETGFTFSAATTRSNAMRVFRALQLVKPLLIEGNPGVGKTTLVTAIAKSVGKQLVRINLSEQTDLMDLFGSDVPVEGSAVGNFAWRDAPFLSAMKNGDWVLLDEMNLASQSVLEGLNSCLDHRAEAYIAELDQTFHRHPSFRLFAAQNPHHQGGGRKGLPASFVNRFTVVYADVFKQDDLGLICKQIFPTIDDERIFALTRFVDTLETDVVRHHRFGARGSPWEFNLRDTLRWLQLQSKSDSLLAAGRPYDFCDVIFRQRFRDSTDREQLDAIFSATFPDQTRQRSFYHNLNTNSYQVGLGLSPRTSIVQKSFVTAPKIPVSQLPVLEALMICVECNWPVLLTGPSGCGKTSILNHLAAITGNQLVTFSMNSDIDAMDLVGGYEQADPSRKRADLLTKVIDDLRYLLLTAWCQEPSAAAKLLQAISTSIWVGSPNKKDVSSLISTLDAARAPIFEDVISRLRVLESLPDQVEKAQFEWVDGLLVRTLQQGAWLVLDNANLCSSSVLDRLNSLLEPSGYLSINEHPTEDGKPRVIKPHPDFRIFFTMDPRYGELSRAMRNRSLELYILPEVTPKLTSTPSFILESAMTRYRNLVALDREETMQYAADHLSFKDFSLHQRFIHQASQGLIGQPQVQQSVVETLGLISNLDPRWVSRTIDFQTIQPLQLLTDGAKQSIHPLNNEIIVRHRNSFLTSSNLVLITQLYDTLLDLQKMSRAFAVAIRQANNRRPVTPFDKSVRQQSFHGGRLEDTIRVAPFLESSLRTLEKFVSNVVESDTPSDTLLRALATIREFWWNLFRFVTSELSDNASYQVLLQLGSEAFQSYKALDEPSTTLLVAQQNLLRELSTGTSLTTGLHMEVLWKLFRPDVAPSPERLAIAQRLNELAGRFDASVFPIRAPLPHLAKVRDNLQHALRVAISENVAMDELVSELLNGIDVLEQSSGMAKSSAIFQVQFEAIYQHLFNSQSHDTVQMLSQLRLLAGRPTANEHSMHLLHNEGNSIRTTLSQLNAYAHGTMIQPTPSAALGGCPMSLLEKLSSLGKVPLSDLGQLHTELEIMASVVSTHAHELCVDQQHLISNILQCHLETWRTQSVSETSSALTALASSTATDPSRHEKLGRDLSVYALSCIFAYVPDRAFDPALKEAVRSQLFIRRKNISVDKIEGLRHFERIFSGQDKSLRISLAEKEMQELGDLVPALPIVRPEKSQLIELSGDFARVLEIARSIETELSNSQTIADNMLHNIVLLVRRLESQYVAYLDIVRPAVQWLQCLWLGSILAKQPLHESTHSGKADPAYWTMVHSLATQEEYSRSCSTIGSLNGMRQIALAQKLDERQDLLKFAWDFFDELFLTWKDTMAEEQAKQTKKSSLYVYRGDHAEEEEVEEEDYKDLFPDYEMASELDQKQRESAVTGETAARVASVHGELFGPAFDTAEYFLNLVASSSSVDIGGTLPNMTTCLPSIYITIQEHLRLVTASSVSKDGYNIYRDANIPEATKLARLVRNVARRFQDLQRMDFEHSTVDDVVRLTSEVLALPHTEPIAKYLTKAEKLYESMYEWEKVAHKGLSAAGLLADFTDLLVSWRRLELSTWMQLFAIEQKKAEDDAKSWWFVAYENIIANPRRLSTEDVALHVPELLKVLGLFFSTATLGQFHQRLQILDHFHAHIKSLLDTFPGMQPIYSGLDNFITYYARFKKPVADSLATHRQQIEKRAREVVQLASWRDTNIEALRQSAKTSHRKLFSLVRKFRALLNRPVASIVEQGPPDEFIGNSALGSSVTSSPLSDMTIVSAFRICSESPGWEEIPPRFKNPVATSNLMQKLGLVPERLDAPNYLNDMINSIHENMKELRDATPPLLTEENKDVVKHLKTRKRLLFADVLKQMRSMGVQYNLNSTVLASQGSSALVFALVLSATSRVDLQAADYHFHKLLSLMPRVREVQREHSSDLTPAEVQRSSGYLEGILYQIIRQRQFLLPLLNFVDELDTLSTKLACLWDDGTSSPARLSRVVTDQSLKICRRKVAWLYPVLHTVGHVLSVQTNLGGLQASSIQQDIAQSLDMIKQLSVEISNIPTFPADIVLTKHVKLQQRIEDAIRTLRENLSSWGDQQPAFTPILRLLLPWVESEFPDVIHSNQDDKASAVQLNSLQSTVMLALDSILASVQPLKGAWDSVPLPGEEVGWLLRHQDVLVTNVKALTPQIIVRNIRECFRVLAALPEDEQDMAIAMLTLLHPVVKQFCTVLHSYSAHFIMLNTTLSQLAHNLSKSFVEIGQSGFCTPAEKTSGEAGAGQEQKLEGGTGLGDGEAAEDISKDIGDDEDLTELAQEPDKQNDGEDISDEKDAVDMADEDMEGQLGETTEKENDEQGEAGDEQENDLEEEIGSVDDLGPEAVDEKMWDDGDKADDDHREKQADQSKGSKNDEQMAAEGEKDNEGEDHEEDEVEAGAQEDEAVGQGKEEQLDDYTEQAEKLDLPEDMNIDGSVGDQSDDQSMNDLEDLNDEVQADEDLGDVAEQEQDAQQGEVGDSLEQHESELEDEAGEAIEKQTAEEDEAEGGELDEGPIPEVNNTLEGQNHDANTAEDAVPSDVQGMGTDNNEQDTNQSSFNSRAKQEEGDKGEDIEDAGGASGEQGSNTDKGQQDAVGRNEDLVQTEESQPFQKLGDALEKWFNQRRQIRQAEDNKPPTRENKKDVDMTDADFEHLLNEETEAEAQALGAATEDQARALNEENAVATNEKENPPQNFVQDEDADETDAGHDPAEDVPMERNEDEDDVELPEDAKYGQKSAFNGDPRIRDPQDHDDSNKVADREVEDEEGPSVEIIRDGVEAVTISSANARILWTQNELKTRTLSATLTEQLRLILAPTLATKLRGDFRTGKRLNIKRIIPYIASSYKRDKIWMRRSVPSKRAYQIMIAVDDSKSMAENGKKELAYETLALVTKALSMLEVGELCVAGFGENVNIAHPFDKPFTDDAGVEIFSALGFEQGDTDVRKLVADGIAIFQDARAKTSSSAKDLWQLMLIVSDAICRDSESIKRLVRKAQEEKIMIVFVVVDAGAKEVDGKQVGSIMDLQGAEFIDGQVKMYRYMDLFPFKWWVVVRDVRELPGVLSMALRQWFAEVVDTGSY